MLCLVCLPCVSCLFCGYSSQCHGFNLSAVCDCDISQSYSLFLGVIHANSDGFGESPHLLGLV